VPGLRTAVPPPGWWVGGSLSSHVYPADGGASAFNVLVFSRATLYVSFFHTTYRLVERNISLCLGLEV
jgi:hypothetical protein